MSELPEYFTQEELQDKTTGIVKLDPHFFKALPIYRKKVGFALHPNSCCRSWIHNASIPGSASSSYHLYEGVEDGREGTLAIDLRVPSDNKRAIMIETALELNWSVGVYKTFIHIDRRVDLGKDRVCFWGH